jgi:hypothetical protein
MSVMTPPLLEPIRRLILECRTEDNWDDEGAVGITQAACEHAIQFLQSVLERDEAIRVPEISPSVFGSVTFHWQRGESHLVVRPWPNTDQVYFRYERPEAASIYGDEPQEQVIHRVVNFFATENAQ